MRQAHSRLWPVLLTAALVLVAIVLLTNPWTVVLWLPFAAAFGGYLLGATLIRRFERKSELPNHRARGGKR